MKKFALIVAGGVGQRMGAEVPKQFIRIAGKPILIWTIERFKAFDKDINIVLVLPESQFNYWKEIALEFNLSKSIVLAKGGETRFQSVRSGLNQIPDERIVFIHDGVRPLVSSETLDNCYRMALEKGNALPVAPVVESLRQVDGDQSKHVDRSQYRLVQTPQTFRSSTIKQAYQQAEVPFFTDDASVCEANGVPIHLVDGNVENLKITRPIDLVIATALLK
ncbi:2-C-methyl-D-erythritol 4-phosphate cytidylyltransferase [uncultured Sunxiuqinia sp.]|uniref:2-C-methyl-D-erythritol 4-phosphate cytidylyltransferase n=1 Tax=uncultured Sunxiuqinia sp. TaxID=1573825 RepID=UPI002AA805FA|nr:2-C-methyl-D-erythritol 4-phosphate cytidylyltransferase [uncultured Sunxiuqinia sp.]